MQIVTSRGPHFIGIGLQKSGTRWLYNQLQHHPDFWMPPIKELHFFGKPFPHPSALKKLSARSTNRSGRDDEFLELLQSIRKSAEPDFAVYESLFSFREELLTGDITPAYSRLEPALIKRIAENLPDVKIILLLRDPISRVWSNINDAAAKGKLPEAALTDASHLESVLKQDSIRSLSYPSQIHARWEKFFPPARCRYFFLDDIIANPGQTRADIIQYLGGDPEKKSGALEISHNSKSGRSRAPIEGDVRGVLIREFGDELRACAQRFGGPAMGWLSKYGLD